MIVKTKQGNVEQHLVLLNILDNVYSDLSPTCRSAKSLRSVKSDRSRTFLRSLKSLRSLKLLRSLKSLMSLRSRMSLIWIKSLTSL